MLRLRGKDSNMEQTPDIKLQIFSLHFDPLNYNSFFFSLHFDLYAEKFFISI